MDSNIYYTFLKKFLLYVFGPLNLYILLHNQFIRQAVQTLWPIILLLRKLEDHIVVKKQQQQLDIAMISYQNKSNKSPVFSPKILIFRYVK